MNKDFGLGYVSLRLALENGTAIRAAIKELPITGETLSPHEMHMTIMYDTSNPVRVGNASAVCNMDATYEGTITGITTLGDAESLAVVLTVVAPGVVNRHEELSIFMTHSFSPFLPHVSVAYHCTADDLPLIEKALTPFVGSSIILYGESFATVKED